MTSLSRRFHISLESPKAYIRSTLPPPFGLLKRFNSIRIDRSLHIPLPALHLPPILHQQSTTNHTLSTSLHLQTTLHNQTISDTSFPINMRLSVLLLAALAAITVAMPTGDASSANSLGLLDERNCVCDGDNNCSCN